MLTVKTRIGPSAIEGIGLFAAEDIKTGTVTWRFVSGFDQLFSADEIAALPEPARTDMINHTYVDAATGHYVLCLDNARFMNHADNPNTRGIHADGAIEGYDIAVRDIACGEELTCDYRQFDRAFDEKISAGADPSHDAL
jgi:SET domain-containing protein